MAKNTTFSSARNRSLGRATAAFAAAILLATSCSGGEVTADRMTEPTAIPVPESVDAQGQTLTLTVVDGGDATGLVMTNSSGYAVYGNTGETSAELICVDDCTQVWIPLEATGGTVSSILDPDLVGMVDRPDGIRQVTYSQVPLYTWSGDDQIGITGGAGVAGTWFALTEAAGFVAEQ